MPCTLTRYACGPIDPPIRGRLLRILCAGEIYRGERIEDSELSPSLVGTSGSTGIPKHTALSARALRASAEATEGFFKSAGSEASQWLLALPAHYVAGAQVLARSVLAGTEPVIARSVTEPVHFSPDVFLRAVERLSSARQLRFPRAHPAAQASRDGAGTSRCTGRRRFTPRSAPSPGSCSEVPPPALTCSQPPKSWGSTS